MQGIGRGLVFVVVDDCELMDVSGSGSGASDGEGGGAEQWLK